MKIKQNLLTALSLALGAFVIPAGAQDVVPFPPASFVMTMPPQAAACLRPALWRWLGCLLLAGGFGFSTSLFADGKSKETIITKGEPGGLLVETTELSATVVMVNKSTREVTMVDPQGRKKTYRAGPEVRNFDQIEPGDRVRAALTEQYLSFVRKPGSEMPASAEQVRQKVVVAPKGAKPSVLIVNTSEHTGRVHSIDTKKRMATIVFADGRRQTFKARPDVDMTRHGVGAEVVFRTTESVAVSITK